MKIEVLGTGCAKCTTLYDNVKAAIKELGRAADVVKVHTTWDKSVLYAGPAEIISP